MSEKQNSLRKKNIYMETLNVNLLEIENLSVAKLQGKVDTEM